MPPRKVPVRKAVPSATPTPVASASRTVAHPSPSKPQNAAIPARHAAAEDDRAEVTRQEGLAEWEEMCRPNWKGLGLMDPIKNVEVSNLMPRTGQFTINFTGIYRINGSYYPLSSRSRAS